LPSFQIARRPLKRYFPTDALHMKLNRLREFIPILKRNLRTNPADARLEELRELSLMLWLCMAFLVIGQFIPSFWDASTTKWLIIVALLLMSYALRVIRKELRDLRKAVTKDVP
jgi:small neutral amino acid transporter SnatA (MarC family)